MTPNLTRFSRIPACRCGAPFVIALILVRFAFATSPTTTPTTDPTISTFIQKLSSEDPTDRQQAADGLIAAGIPARAAVLAAMKSDDPDIHSQAAQILLKLPWGLPSDPPFIRQRLSDYGSLDVPGRRRFVKALADSGRTGSISALARLVVEDPSDDVRWSIVARLRPPVILSVPQTSVLPPVALPLSLALDRFQEKDFPPDSDAAAACALAGYAWIGQDPAKAEGFFQHCADLEFAHPSSTDAGEFDRVISALSDIYCGQKKFDLAAGLRRGQLQRETDASDEKVPPALVELFILHANYGPLTGFDADLKLAGNSIHSAKLQYCLAAMNARTSMPEKSDAARQSALAASVTMQEHYQIAAFLFQRRWNEFARQELAQTLALAANDTPANTQWHRINAQLLLCEIAKSQNDDLAFAQHRESWLTTLAEGGNWYDATGPLDPASDFLWAEIYWHYYRAAAAGHDEKEMQTRLDQLIARKPYQLEIAVEMVPVLRQRGSATQADEIFQRSYDALKILLDKDPTNTQIMNNLSWLCAQCDEHLDEALTLATAANRSDPTSPYFMDTLAEVYYRQKNYTQAIQLETKAVVQRPGDPFFLAQLKKFQSPTTTPSTQP